MITASQLKLSTRYTRFAVSKVWGDFTVKKTPLCVLCMFACDKAQGSYTCLLNFKAQDALRKFLLKLGCLCQIPDQLQLAEFGGGGGELAGIVHTQLSFGRRKITHTVFKIICRYLFLEGKEARLRASWQYDTRTDRVSIVALVVWQWIDHLSHTLDAQIGQLWKVLSYAKFWNGYALSGRTIN